MSYTPSITVRLPEAIIKRIDERVGADKEYTTRSDYVKDVLRRSLEPSEAVA